MKALIFIVMAIYLGFVVVSWQQLETKSRSRGYYNSCLLGMKAMTDSLYELKAEGLDKIKVDKEAFSKLMLEKCESVARSQK